MCHRNSPPVPFANLAVRSPPSPCIPPTSTSDALPGQTNAAVGEKDRPTPNIAMCICMRGMYARQCACHFSPSPPSLTFSSAFGYSSNRFPLSHTANDDNERTTTTTTVVVISLSVTQSCGRHGPQPFPTLSRGHSLLLYYTCSLHCSTRWGCFSADTGLTEH